MCNSDLQSLSAIPKKPEKWYINRLAKYNVIKGKFTSKLDPVGFGALLNQDQ